MDGRRIVRLPEWRSRSMQFLRPVTEIELDRTMCTHSIHPDLFLVRMLLSLSLSFFFFFLFSSDPILSFDHLSSFHLGDDVKGSWHGMMPNNIGADDVSPSTVLLLHTVYQALGKKRGQTASFLLFSLDKTGLFASQQNVSQRRPRESQMILSPSTEFIFCALQKKKSSRSQRARRGRHLLLLFLRFLPTAQGWALYIVCMSVDRLTGWGKAATW